MNVSCVVKGFEDNKTSVTVKNHWNRSTLVDIKIDDGGETDEITVVAAELIKAINNATNV